MNHDSYGCVCERDWNQRGPWAVTIPLGLWWFSCLKRSSSEEPLDWYWPQAGWKPPRWTRTPLWCWGPLLCCGPEPPSDGSASDNRSQTSGLRGWRRMQIPSKQKFNGRDHFQQCAQRQIKVYLQYQTDYSGFLYCTQYQNLLYQKAASKALVL